jgi:hypothetical protein
MKISVSSGGQNIEKQNFGRLYASQFIKEPRTSDASKFSTTVRANKTGTWQV